MNLTEQPKKIDFASQPQNIAEMYLSIKKKYKITKKLVKLGFHRFDVELEYLNTVYNYNEIMFGPSKTKTNTTHLDNANEELNFVRWKLGDLHIDLKIAKRRVCEFIKKCIDEVRDNPNYYDETELIKYILDKIKTTYIHV